MLKTKEAREQKKSVKIRGVKFFARGSFDRVPFSDLASMYFIVKAIEGDELAREILDKTGQKVISDGKQIYPPEK